MPVDQAALYILDLVAIIHYMEPESNIRTGVRNQPVQTAIGLLPIAIIILRMNSPVTLIYPLTN